MFTELMNDMQYGNVAPPPPAPIYPPGMNPLDPMHQLQYITMFAPSTPPTPQLHQMMADISQYGGGTVKRRTEEELAGEGGFAPTAPVAPAQRAAPSGRTVNPADVQQMLQRRAIEEAAYRQQQQQQLRAKQEGEAQYLEQKRLQEAAEAAKTQEQLGKKVGGRAW